MKRQLMTMILAAGTMLGAWAEPNDLELLFSEGFEGGVLPVGWTCDSGTGDSEWTVGTGDYGEGTGAHGGSCNAKKVHTTTGDACKLITPAINLGGWTEGVMLDFWFVNRSWSGDIDQLNVYYRTDSGAEWQMVTNIISRHDTWTECMLALENLTSTYQIAFECVDKYGYGVGIDDVSITCVGSAEDPLTFEVTAAIAAIDAIGEVVDTDECKAKIDAARETYDALTDEQKAFVTNYGTLTAAEAAYAAFGHGGETPFTVTQPWTANAKAVLNGAMYDAAGNVAGVAQLKVSKPKTDKKKGVKTVKVSGYLLPNSGKKVTLKSTTAVVSASAPTEVPVPAKQLGTFRVKIGDDGFLGTAGAYTAHTAGVGGKWTRGNAKVYAVATSAPLPDGTLEDLLPDGEPVVAKGGKWSFAKASSVKYAKDAKTKALTLTVNDRNGTAGNRSAMKLTYTPKTGVFKGSFKVYAIQGGKLKKFTVKVNGVVVEGEGTGIGKLAKPAVTWSVSVR